MDSETNILEKSPGGTEVSDLEPPAASRVTRRSRDWRSAVPVAVALGLFSAGTLTGYVFGLAKDPGTDSVMTTTTTVAAVEIVDPGSEPYIAVAELLQPSIVRIETLTGVGSGVIYDGEEGLIMTAAHVIDGLPEPTVRVQLWDGRLLEGTVIGSDSGNDIAVVKVLDTGLTPAGIALDQLPKVGQRTIAVGSPWGLDSTVTAGIVSAYRNLYGRDELWRSVIQTDASINPGNSGGALADMSGRVIGINVMIFTESGASDGVGFAVPIGRAHRVAERLVSGETYVPGYLGVRGGISEVGDDVGAEVVEVFPGSAADSAGIQVDDYVISVDGVRVARIDDLAAALQDREAGDSVVLGIRRDMETFDITVTLGVRPPKEPTG